MVWENYRLPYCQINIVFESIWPLYFFMFIYALNYLIILLLCELINNIIFTSLCIEEPHLYSKKVVHFNLKWDCKGHRYATSVEFVSLTIIPILISLKLE